MVLPSDRQERLLFGLAAALIALFLIQDFAESLTHSVTSDEAPHLASGLSYLETGRFIANAQHPPLMKELAGLSLLLGGIRWPKQETPLLLAAASVPKAQPEWDIGYRLLAAQGPDRVMAWARAPMLLVSAMLAAVLFLWGRQLIGGWAALGAVFLYTMDPTILGHSYLVTTDVGVSAFTLLFLMALWSYICKPGRRGMIFCGVTLGLVLCAKFSAVLIVPMAGVLLIASVVWPLQKAESRTPAEFPRHDPPARGKKGKAERPAEPVKTAPPATVNLARPAGVFAVMCAIAVVVIQAIYLFSSDPSLYLHGLMKVNADHMQNYPMYMAGTMSNRHYTYFAVAWFLKEPLATIVLAAIGKLVLLRSKEMPLLAKIFLLLPPAVMFLGATFMAADVGIRYVMPVLPFGHLLGGLGLVTVFRFGKWGRAAAAALCAWVALAAFAIYPDRLPYFNESACLLNDPGKLELAGGWRCGPAWLDDSNVDWGQGLKQLKAWQDSNPGDRTFKISTPFRVPPPLYGIRSQGADMKDIAGPPHPGLYAVSSDLVGRMTGFGVGQWMSTVPPVAIVGHSTYIYDIR